MDLGIENPKNRPGLTVSGFGSKARKPENRKSHTLGLLGLDHFD